MLVGKLQRPSSALPRICTEPPLIPEHAFLPTFPLTIISPFIIPFARPYPTFPCTVIFLSFNRLPMLSKCTCEFLITISSKLSPDTSNKVDSLYCFDP